MSRLIGLFLILLFFLTSCNRKKELFERMPAEYTGVTFSNRITENDSINILRFDYIYNGAGVGVADFNNDGLQDLVFTGNQVGNKIYLNKGDFKFEDITETANISGDGKWCSGLALVDINNDKKMDIYIAVTSTNNTEPARRENLLYVNQGLQSGKPVFKEMAAEYGINDNGHSENAAFFDYDNDGDLDLYVLTNRIGKWPSLFADKIVDGSNPNTDRLYRNDWSEEKNHPIFTNVSAEAGILIEGYGLGINITDVNQDGWKDIYITNDYITDDLLYVNNQDGTFTDQAKKYFKHTSQSAMGNDVADINNDGLQDFVALDMLPRYNERKKMFINGISLPFFQSSKQFGFTYQYMRNTLQLNNGNDSFFSDISLLADVAETDWSWDPSLADFDNDGYRDLLITNGFPRDITDRDFMAYRTQIANLMDLNYILDQIPVVKISNYAFKNTGDLKFEDVTKDWGLEIPSFSNGAVYADLDNDGDLDYVVNNINDSAFVYQNHTDVAKNHYLRFGFEGNDKNQNGIGAIIKATKQNGELLFFENNPFRGYKSTIENFAHFGLGSDTVLNNVVVIWPDHKFQKIGTVKTNQTLLLKYSDAGGEYDFKEKPVNAIFKEDPDKFEFKHRQVDFVDFNIQNLLPSRLSRMGPSLAVADINGDGLDDFYVCGPKFINGTFFIQKSDGTFHKDPIIAPTDSLNKNWEDTGVLFFDADNDGDQDLYIATGGNEAPEEDPSFADRFYENDGNGKLILKNEAIPSFYSSGSCVRAADIDNDGDLDLFVGGRQTPQQYPKPTSSFILINESSPGKIKFADQSDARIPDLKNFGLVNDALWTDFDNDSDFDLIIAGDFAAIQVFENTNGKFKKLANTGLENQLGMWNSINGADLDHDGDIDYILGNIGENELLKGNSEKPAYILSGDFDKNSVYDIIPFVYFRENALKTKLVPYNTKDDVHKMLNPTRSRFTTYKEFVSADMDNLLTKEELKMAHKSELNYVQSAVMINLGKGKFKLSPLPVLAQVSPVNATLIDDYNQDGHFDVLLVANNYSYEVMVGQLDASNGLLLLGDGKGNFKPKLNSGFNVPGDAKSLVSLVSADNSLMLIASQNSQNLKQFSLQLKFKIKQAPTLSKRVTYYLKSHKQVKEIYHGVSYLSQSSKKIILPFEADYIKIE